MPVSIRYTTLRSNDFDKILKSLDELGPAGMLMRPVSHNKLVNSTSALTTNVSYYDLARSLQKITASSYKKYEKNYVLKCPRLDEIIFYSGDKTDDFDAWYNAAHIFTVQCRAKTKQ